jgi:hypothetical protein
MIKKLLVTSLLGLSLMMSGCGDIEGEDRLETQQMLDAGNFAGVISRLEGSADESHEYISLAAAYMGRGGLDLVGIFDALGSSKDSSSTSGFSTFTKSISKVGTSTALVDLDSAIINYKKVVQNSCLNDAGTLTSTQKTICFYVGLASTSSAAIVINLIAGDLKGFGDSAMSDDKLLASTCAMQYGIAGRDDTNINGNCSIAESSAVNFTIIQKIYTPLIVTVKAKAYYYLMNDSNQTVMTKDYCLKDNFSRYEDINAVANLYACPINETPNAKEFTTAEVLVELLNDGLGTISNTSNGDTKKSIDEFKCEILTGKVVNDKCSKSNDINSSNIIEYLNDQN